MFDAGGIRIGYMLRSASMLITGASINSNVGRSQFEGSGQGGIKKKISSKPLSLSSARYVRRMQRKGNNGLYIRKTDNKKNYFFCGLGNWEWTCFEVDEVTCLMS